MESLTTPRVAAELGISEQRVRQLIADQKIPAKKLPYGTGVWLVQREDLDAFKKKRDQQREE